MCCAAPSPPFTPRSNGYTNPCTSLDGCIRVFLHPLDLVCHALPCMQQQLRQGARPAVPGAVRRHSLAHPRVQLRLNLRAAPHGRQGALPTTVSLSQSIFVQTRGVLPCKLSRVNPVCIHICYALSTLPCCMRPSHPTKPRRIQTFFFRSVTHARADTWHVFV